MKSSKKLTKPFKKIILHRNRVQVKKYVCI